MDKILQLDENLLARPFRLVSLFNLMVTRLNASFFYSFAEFQERVIQTHPSRNELLNDDTKATLRAWIQDNIIDFTPLGLTVSITYLNIMLSEVDLLPLPMTEAKWHDMMEKLHTIVKTELESILFLHVDSNAARRYEQKAAFGQKATDNFQSATYDIEEAGNCLALGRNTACVMHLARVVEVALKAVRTALALPPLPVGKQMNWGEILRQIWDEIGARNKVADPIWMAKQKPFFENVHADLSSVKNAWRNPSVHADAIYDPERADDIFNMTKSFMRHLAEHLDESGTFTP